ncbi:MAG TPA: adenylate/guanylate cyclase domain-containing protein [Candidatus Sulfotelmatobacter sp.]|jgi:adenylate cyclase|nr:adenylate/guanylate cyclase domain-containing protein [Candidatus Sulfotelmatobacter sp.]
MAAWGVFKRSWWAGLLNGGRLVALAVLVVLVGLRVSDPAALETARAKTFDLYQKWHPRPTPETPPVVIIDLDDASLAEFGQWPWPRTLLAKMVDNLTAAGTAAVGFDVVFAEEDRLSPDKVAASVPGIDGETSKRLASLPSNDQVFAKSISNSRVVLGMGGLEAPRATKGTLPPDVPGWGRFGTEDPVPWVGIHGSYYPAVLRNIPVIDNAASGWGVFTVTPETDGVVRRVPAVVTDGTELYPALSTELLRLGTASESFGISTGDDGVQFIKLGRSKVLTDGHGRIWVYARAHDPSLYLPAKDVLKGTFDPARVAGKLAIVGTSAVGLGDIRAIATERQISGVEVHAQIIESILFAQQLIYPSGAQLTEMLAAGVAGLLMIVLVPLIGARWTMLLFLAVAASIAGGSWYEFSQKLTLFDPVLPTVTALLCYIITTYTSFAREEAQKRYVRGAMGRYMSPALVEKVAGNPGLLKLGGETKDMTLLFCDIRGFTTISETFGADAQGLTKLINRFLTPMTDIILERKGTIDKYMGDCIMAFWNAPLDDPEHAANACAAALKMKQDLEPLNARLEEQARTENRRHVPINIGIGLNSGDVVVGNMGSDQRFDYSVLGDNVNLASRLEGQSKPYGVTVVIGENTYQRAPGFACLELDLIKVKGKTEAVRIFTLLGDEALAKSSEFQTLKAEHDKILAAYRAQDWTAARAGIVRALELDPGFHLEKLYHLYEERMQEYEANPPGADWDGVFTATSK